MCFTSKNNSATTLAIVFGTSCQGEQALHCFSQEKGFKVSLYCIGYGTLLCQIRSLREPVVSKMDVESERRDPRPTVLSQAILAQGSRVFGFQVPSAIF
mmetsp:Transcript_41780/g.77306  ORF Transcript_41780/g.77306 Transcript_41780/m.77306 type:complete len:99 (+) Transcript_41780:953-1249(+)